MNAAELAAASRERSNAAVGLRAVVNSIQMISAMLKDTLEDGQRALRLLPRQGADTVYVEKLSTQLMHTTNLIANAQLALPVLEELNRHIRGLQEVTPRQGSGQAGKSSLVEVAQ